MMRIKMFSFIFLILVPATFFSQTGFLVEGAVSDNYTGNPLPGATILIKEDTTVAVASFEGKFTLQLKSSKASLEFSYVGYKTKTINVVAGNTYQVKLEPESHMLNEVILVGYGAVKEQDKTGAISSIKPPIDIANLSQGIETILQGQASGVQVSANGGIPGTSVSVKIRGLNSLTNSSEPLYVVDGIIIDAAIKNRDKRFGNAVIYQGGLFGIDPSDIQSIRVLKDASALAIYGSRASNGVVIITTKKGDKGKAKFTYTTSTTIGEVVRSIDVLNTDDYIGYQNKNRELLGLPAFYSKDANGKIYINNSKPLLIKPAHWASSIYALSVMKKNRLSVLGGNDSGDYYFSGGVLAYIDDLPKVKDFNLNINQNLNKKLKMGLKLSGAYTELPVTIRGGMMNVNTGLHRQIVLAPPIQNLEVHNQYIEDADQIQSGPMAWITEYEDLARETRLLGRLQVDYKLTDYLNYALTIGGDYSIKKRKIWFGTGIFIGRQHNGLSILNRFNQFRYNINHTLTLKKTINTHHKIKSVVGYVIDQSRLEKARYKSSNFPNKSLKSNGISFGQAFTNYKIDSEFPAIKSFIARINYSLLNKYLFTGTFRADGSSRFIKENRWGYFPAFSVAWKLTEEPFFKRQQFFTTLKVRMGYGEVGNQNINSYRTLTFLNETLGGLATADGGNEIAIAPRYLSNKNLKWESSKQYNLGVDYSLFKNSVKGSIDVYHKFSSDLLLNIAIASSTGFNAVLANQGSLVNQGIEFSLTADLVKRKKMGWNVFGNVSFNKNKIGFLGLNPSKFGALGQQVAFLGSQISKSNYFKQPANIYIQGREAGLFYGFKTKGIILTKEQLDTTPNDGDLNDNLLKYRGQEMRLGDVYFVDQNADGDITDADKTIIGNPNPDFIYSLGSTLTYKNFTLSLMLNGVHGNQIANGNTMESGYANNTATNIRAVAYHDAWHPIKNTAGNYPYVGVGALGPDYTKEFNDRNVEDGSFLRLSYATLSYSLPLKKTAFVDNVKLFFAGQNLLLWTKYSGFDPEVDSFPYDATKTGIDWGSSPKQRTFTMGLNIIF